MLKHVKYIVSGIDEDGLVKAIQESASCRGAYGLRSDGTFIDELAGLDDNKKRMQVDIPLKHFNGQLY